MAARNTVKASSILSLATASIAARRSFTQYLPSDHLKDPTCPQFMVGKENGFLPRQDPLVELPSEFKELESLLQRMPLTTAKGEVGLLAKGEFGKAVAAELPEYNVDHITDSQVLNALYRDYCFATSAYLLEPCDIYFREKKDYGLGRDVLPRNIAVPLAKVSEKLGAKPFLEYTQGYGLYNFTRLDKTKPIVYGNVRPIRYFAGMPSETGFILVHVAMAANSSKQVTHVLGALDAVKANDRTQFDLELHGILSAMQSVNAAMENMWTVSAPKDYMKYRTFIMGTKNQPMFPKGVVYEGVSPEPTFYRGETGANDSIIPTADNFLELTGSMPDNPLTEILRDFRSYRPANHTDFLTWLEKEAKTLGVRAYSVQNSTSAVRYLAILDQIREYRARHWNFTKEYIIKWTDHPVATGGSPITTWLPNQLESVLRAIEEISKSIHPAQLSEEDKKLSKELLDRAEVQRRILTREVDALRKRFGQ
ncbi:hypothetical protein BATDEDRAFT_10068 [Batrachochytrium dendrobatidis JAM81]|uniref:Indoleamine 2,3-dioxygenase n=3 Tax=Batrachochytrium dendrobatidis TaxID=109871 RepID=F4NXS0_BATDJ|nr:uncharacterized protein BATDEDRAFT_10068 [Batrachochytrium dendrobatidis JAM81]EGF81897.1 hypothetical protein BATDEDRAFT_10068 [Batrachochytrium dendrobatidis JAM81]BAO42883.1 indoleamine 2,3-dioxygenase gamma-isoform [Batrachochytrium dendrobatidis]|eukprot:XP_006677141.1 hypothetical protein BATDEDRAFT_10068 [Batrachochytrium dendrobatidis JAM81]